MELDKFQVPDFGPRPPGHHHPIATGHGRIGGVGKQVAAATGGEHHRTSPQPIQLAVLKHLEALAATTLHPELEGNGPFALLQAWALEHLPLQGVNQGAAGAVLGMEHPPMAVGGLQGGAELVAVAIKGHAQLQQPGHASRGLMHQQLYGGTITETCPRLQGVGDMAGKTVVVVGDRGNAALGPAACGAG